MMMMMMLMKTNALASNDPRSGDDGSLLASSPSGSLPEVRFHGFLVVMCLASQIRLRGVIIFDEVVLMTGGPDRTTRH